MNLSRLKSKDKLLLIILFTSLFVYVILRAYLLSFTHDESLSYTIVEGKITWGKTANNHLLNTLLMSLSSSLFGMSELGLRLPNVLSFFDIKLMAINASSCQ